MVHQVYVSCLITYGCVWGLPHTLSHSYSLLKRHFAINPDFSDAAANVQIQNHVQDDNPNSQCCMFFSFNVLRIYALICQQIVHALCTRIRMYTIGTMRHQNTQPMPKGG